MTHCLHPLHDSFLTSFPFLSSPPPFVSLSAADVSFCLLEFHQAEDHLSLIFLSQIYWFQLDAEHKVLSALGVLQGFIFQRVFLSVLLDLGGSLLDVQSVNNTTRFSDSDSNVQSIVPVLL